MHPWEFYHDCVFEFELQMVGEYAHASVAKYEELSDKAVESSRESNNLQQV